MNSIKIALKYIKNLPIVYDLIIKLSKKKIIITKPRDADLIFVGSSFIMDQDHPSVSMHSKLFRHALRKMSYKNLIPSNFELDFYLGTLGRRFKPIKIFYTRENLPHNTIDCDYSITNDIAADNPNHLRIPNWKDHIDWSENNSVDKLHYSEQIGKRFGSLLKISELMKPQGSDFIFKNRNMSLITSHLREPRRSMYLKFSSHFKVDGYGPFFDKRIKHHNKSNFTKKEIMSDYAFNLCPENTLYPGFYTEKVPESFIAKSLPITWADHNINYDFNEKAFINLINYQFNNYEDIIELLKQDSFLKKFTHEPLLLKSINLEKETIFIEKILKKL